MSVKQADAVRELRAANRNCRNSCKELLTRSRVPAALKSTLQHILEHFGSPTLYTLAWPSHGKLAEIQGLSERSIEWHCKAILASGLLTAEQLGARAARQRLKAEFGYQMKGTFLHRLTFYSINRNHPFWAGEEGAIETVITLMKEALRGRDKARTRRDTNPVAGYGSNPVAGYTTNPVAGYGQAPLLEETTGVVSKPLHPAKPEPSPEGLASRENRGDAAAQDAPLSGEEDSPSVRERSADTDIILGESLKERLADAETQIIADNRNNFSPTSSDWSKTSVALRAMDVRILQSQGRHLTADELVAALNSDSFRGLKRHSWGLICARTRDKRSDDFICRLYTLEEEIITEMKKPDAAKATPAVKRNHALEQALADALLYYRGRCRRRVRIPYKLWMRLAVRVLEGYHARSK
jgi:hypothetical protein